jgi:hypothetical protein
LGEFQPCKTESSKSKKRIPVGEPIKDYYPQIIEPELFERALNAREQRKNKGGFPVGGRRGINIANLFSGLVHCAHCDSSVHFINKGRGDSYLFCHGARNGMKCDHRQGWRYKDFESSFLTFVEALDLKSITSDQQQDVKRKELDQEISALAGKLVINEKAQDNLIKLQEEAKGGGTERVAKRITELNHEHKTLQSEIESKRKTRADLDVRSNEFHAAHAEIKDIIARLQTKDGDEIYRLRAEVAGKLKSLVETISLSPGDLPNHQKTVPHVITFPTSLRPMLQKNLRKVPNRFFMVEFKSDALQVVTFHPVNAKDKIDFNKVIDFGWEE